MADEKKQTGETGGTLTGASNTPAAKASGSPDEVSRGEHSAQQNVLAGSNPAPPPAQKDLAAEVGIPQSIVPNIENADAAAAGMEASRESISAAPKPVQIPSASGNINTD